MPKNGLIRAYDSELQIFQRFADAVIIFACFALAVWIRGIEWNDKFTIAAMFTVVLFYLFSKPANLYQSYRIGGILEEIKPVIATWTVTVASVIIIGYGFKVAQDYSRLAIAVVIVTVPTALIAWRFAVRRVLMWLRVQGRNTRSVVVIGINETALDLGMSIVAQPWTGLKVIGYVTPQDEKRSEVVLADYTRIPVLGDVGDLYELARANRVDIAYIAVPLSQRKLIDKILATLGDTTISMYIVPDIYTADIMQGHWVTVGSIPTVSVIDNPLRGFGSWLKRLEDIVVSVIVLAMMAIPMAIIAIAIKATSKGPVFYIQKRYGLACEPINVYKFRTMTVTETDEEFKQATANDPRVTPLGSWLRRTSLDELPQFINVLKGEMSVVGPRPHAVAHNEQYRGRIDSYTLRHKIKPGITGLAQVYGHRGQTSSDGAMAVRVRHDIEYINSWSIWMDLKILLATPLVLIKGENAF